MIRCDAMKIGWKQDKDGYILTLRLHPQDAKRTPEIGEADIGSQWRLTLVELDDDGNAREVMPNTFDSSRPNKIPPDPATGIAPGRAHWRETHANVQKMPLQTPARGIPNRKTSKRRSALSLQNLHTQIAARKTQETQKGRSTFGNARTTDSTAAPQRCCEIWESRKTYTLSRMWCQSVFSFSGRAPSRLLATIKCNMALSAMSWCQGSNLATVTSDKVTRGSVESRHAAPTQRRISASGYPAESRFRKTGAGVAPGPRDTNATPAAIDDPDEQRPEQPEACVDGRQMPGEIKAGPSRGGATPALNHAGEAPAAMAHGNEAVWPSASPRGEPAPGHAGETQTTHSPRGTSVAHVGESPKADRGGPAPVSNAGDIHAPARGAAPPQPPSQAAPRPFTSLPLSQQAALLCNDPRFWAFIWEEWKLRCGNSSAAAAAIYLRYRISSRAELKPDNALGKKFIRDRDRFLAWKWAT